MFAIMYADNTYFLINSTDKNKLIKQLNVELESFCIWFKSNNFFLIGRFITNQRNIYIG